uniref:Uncharacterized protein n=1 Tax=Panagrolaimus sp. PS1159 TaxID=55785 RepID=A0AC35GI59_9BILA
MSSNFGEKNYAAFVNCENLDRDIVISAMDLSTQKQLLNFHECYPANNVKKFIKDIPTKFKGFKSIILSVFGFHSDEYKNNLEFCNEIRAKLQLINVQYLFIKDGTMMFLIPIYAAGIKLQIRENVVTATFVESSFRIINFVLTENGYLPSKVESIPYGRNDNVKNICKNIFNKFNPKELIIVAEEDKRTKFGEIKDVHFVAYGCLTYPGYIMKLIADYSKWMHDKNSVNTLVVPTMSNSNYLFVKYLAEKRKVEDFVSKNGTQILPFTKTLLLPKSKNFIFAVLCMDKNLEKLEILLAVSENDDGDTLVLCMDRKSEKPEILLAVSEDDDGDTLVVDSATFPEPTSEQIHQNQKYHGIKFTFEIDINNFPSLTFRPMILKGIKILPQTLNDKMKELEIPVIGFFGNLSVICVRKNDEDYKFLEEWGGMFGSELYISFDEEKQKFGETASAMLETKPSFVVYDLIKIMSMPPGEIDIDETWHFSIKEDSENPVLIEFDNFDGEKSSASPAFLLAILLKQHLKAIKNEIGGKPKKIGFCFFKVDDSVKERLKNEIVKSFELLKVESQFIDI